jgi:hypothetical protein
MLPHGTANVEQEHELLAYALTSRPSCGTMDMQDTNRIYLTESGIAGGGHLEDASHVIDHTDSDQSVIEELDPTILLETRGGFRGGVPPKIRKAYVIQR